MSKSDLELCHSDNTSPAPRALTGLRGFFARIAARNSNFPFPSARTSPTLTSPPALATRGTIPMRKLFRVHLLRRLEFVGKIDTDTRQ